MVQRKQSSNRRKRISVLDTKAAMEQSCRTILASLVPILLKLGISANEFSNISRSVFVKIAASQVKQSIGRVNKSRVAVATGLTRAEVNRLLIEDAKKIIRFDWHMHRSHRVLKGWYEDPDFTDNFGKPQDLSLRGRHPSFATLVKRYSGDIPVRAMLDELMAASMVKRMPTGLIRTKGKTLRPLGVKPAGVTYLGERTGDFLNTLSHNLQKPNIWRFEGSVSSPAIDTKLIPHINHAVTRRGQSFLDSISDYLDSIAKRSSKAAKEAESKTRVGLTVFLHEHLDSVPSVRKRPRKFSRKVSSGR